MNAIEKIEARYLRSDIPEFRPGDTVRVHAKIQEAGKERIQVFEGAVIADNRVWREERPWQFEVARADLVAEVRKLLERQRAARKP